MEFIDKEVYFDKYCKTCIHKGLPESEDPCHECLQNPSNVNSHKPVNHEEDK